MQQIANRAKELLPSVLLTLISIIQALALEVLWSKLRESSFLWEPGHAAALGWLQVAAVFQVILVGWLVYTSLVMRFRWTPSIRDSIIPFVIGLGQFTLVELIGGPHLHGWFYLFAGVFAFSSWASAVTIGRAGEDPDNRALFREIDSSALHIYGPPVLFTMAVVGLGAAVQLMGARGVGALVCLILINLILLVQIGVIRFYWVRSLEQ